MLQTIGHALARGFARSLGLQVKPQYAKSLKVHEIPPEPVEILPHSLWDLKPRVESDPFPSRYQAICFVREVKNGWIRYQIGNGSLFPDERKTIEEFLICYRPHVRSSRCMPQDGWQ